MSDVVERNAQSNFVHYLNRDTRMRSTNTEFALPLLGGAAESRDRKNLVGKLLVECVDDHFARILAELPRLNANNILHLGQYEHHDQAS